LIASIAAHNRSVLAWILTILNVPLAAIAASQDLEAVFVGQCAGSGALRREIFSCSLEVEKMSRSSFKIVLSACGAGILLLTSGAAFAGHGKAGLWEYTVTLGGQGAMNMPDMSKLPPEAQAAMRAHGINMSGDAISVQHCRTAEEFNLDKPPPVGAHDKSCAMTNVSYTGSHMSADMNCTGKFQAQGHAQFDWDSDEHFTGSWSVTGMANGTPITQSAKFEGRYLSASCGSVKN
jgi:hypothetical protein